MSAQPSDGIARHRMPLTWLGLFVLANGVLSVLGPRLVASLPKGRVFYGAEGADLVFSRDFQGLFASHLISNPPKPNEKRLAIIGNCMILRESFAQSVQRELDRAIPGAEVYCLAWRGLTLSGQAQFAVTSLRYHPDLVVWSISPLDCRKSAPVFGATDDPAEIRYGEGLVAAMRNFRHLSPDNGRYMLYNAMGEVLPFVRYNQALQAVVPKLPKIDLVPDPATTAPPGGPTPRFWPRSQYPPSAAVNVLDATKPHLDRAGVRLVVLIMPHSCYETAFEPGQFEEFRSLLTDWCANHGTQLLDLSEVLPTQAFIDEVHFTNDHYPEVVPPLISGLMPSLSEAGAS